MNTVIKCFEIKCVNNSKSAKDGQGKVVMGICLCEDITITGEKVCFDFDVVEEGKK